MQAFLILIIYYYYYQQCKVTRRNNLKKLFTSFFELLVIIKRYYTRANMKSKLKTSKANKHRRHRPHHLQLHLHEMDGKLRVREVRGAGGGPEGEALAGNGVL